MRGGDFEKSVQLYLREAGRYPPLGADEEKRLAQAKKVLESFYKREKDSKKVPTFVEKNFSHSAIIQSFLA